MNQNQFEYFEKTTTNIVNRIIDDQGADVCRHIIETNYIDLETKDYDYGFICKKHESQSTPQYVYDFILCKMFPIFDEVSISLVCSRTNTKFGKTLVSLACEKAKAMGYTQVSLLIIGDTKLLNWYKSQDFIRIGRKPLPNSKLQAYSMKKML
jgi:hypothetical protein